MSTSRTYGTIALLLLILVSISGVSIHRMTCFISGNSIVSIGEQIEPCCDKLPENSISEHCCDQSVVALQLEEFNRAQDAAPIVQPVLLTPFAPVALVKIRTVQFPQKRANAPPPPHFGNLALYEVFRL